MKFLASFCLVLVCCSSLAQNQTEGSAYELMVPEESDLLTVLDRFGRTYAVDFAYSPEILAGERVPAGFFSGGSLEELLAQLLAHSALNYRIVAANRVLVRKKAAGSEVLTPELLSLSGQVIDAAGGQPLPYVAISLDTLNLATTTGQDGRFTLSIPAGLDHRRLLVSRLGYRDTAVVAGAWFRRPTLGLEVQAVQLTEVKVVEKLPAIGYRALNASSTLRLSRAAPTLASQLSGRDIFRAVQLLPGVAATDDLSAGLKIRGSNADETLILLDGIPIYQADHFYGIFSAINSAYVEKVELFKNTLPIEYSGRTAGMLLMESAGKTEDFSAKADVNLLYSALQASLPLSDNWGVSLAGRTSYVNVASSKFFNWVGSDPQLSLPGPNPDFARRDVIQTVPDFYFNDLNAKLLFSPNDRHQLSFNLFRSRDTYSNTYSNTFRTRERILQVTNFEDFANEESWSNNGLSLHYSGHLTNRWTLRANAYYSSFAKEGLIFSSLTQVRPNESRTLAFENQQRNQIQDWGGRFVISNRDHKQEGLRAGVSLSRRANVFELRTDENIILNGEPRSTESTLFAEYRWAVLPDWHLTLGGRLHHYDLTGQFYGSPLLQTQYELSPDLSLKGAFSVHYQFVREVTHETRLGQSLDFLFLSDGAQYPVGKAVQYMAGATFKKGSWSVDLEFFHKDMDQVLEHASLFPGFLREEIRPSDRTDYQLFQGQGQVNGLDLALGYERSVYSGWLAYTLSKLTNQFPEVRNNEPFPAQDDRRHQLQWVNSLRLGRFDLSANLIYASGRPYTDLSRLSQEEDRRTLSAADRISYLPSYQRIDLGVAYNFPVKNTRATAGFSVFNLTNRDNVKYLQYIYSISANRENTLPPTSTVIGTETILLDRTLNLFLNWRF
jgi:ferric enterobactin receptor